MAILDEDTMVGLYNTAKAAMVGEIIRCPGCNVPHRKTAYNKVFCSNSKTKKGGNCKDTYHNCTNTIRAKYMNIPEHRLYPEDAMTVPDDSCEYYECDAVCGFCKESTQHCRCHYD